MLDPDDRVCWRQRIATPRGDVGRIIDAIAGMIGVAEKTVGARASIGVGTPGSLSPRSGLLRGSNSVELNGLPLDRMIEQRLGRPVRIANDADCFALSEATDGAAAGARCVFGVILGTGVGAGIVIDGRLHAGRLGISGEWGHNPLPWMDADELANVSACYCGKQGCVETWLSGPGIAAHLLPPLAGLDTQVLASREAMGDELAVRALDQVADRLARALASVINVLDPEVIVLGGGVSNIAGLYPRVNRQLGNYVFSDDCDTPVVPSRHGDASGVRGAAWLWPRSGSL